MRGYFIKRILATIPVMMVVAIFVFSLLRLTPGDPAAIIAGDYANPKDVAQIRQQLGLDEPLYLQFGICWNTPASADQLYRAWGAVVGDHRSGGEQSHRSPAITFLGTPVWDRSPWAGYFCTHNIR